MEPVDKGLTDLPLPRSVDPHRRLAEVASDDGPGLLAVESDYLGLPVEDLLDECSGAEVLVS